MVNYITELTKASTQKLTENGAGTYSTSDSKVLDFFAQAGAMRGRTENEIIQLFQAALDEDLILALKTLFYIRDVRKGQGERRVFRVCIKHLVSNTELVVNVTKLYSAIVEFGRYDDLYEFVGTPLEKGIFEQLKVEFENQLQYCKTKNDTKLTLLGKWLKSENASSEATNKLGTITRKYLRLTSKQYRKALSLLRARLKIVERQMCAKDWFNIEYSRVPSQAMLKYKGAFLRHDETDFKEYLNSVNRGESKINTSTLAPYQIISDYRSKQYTDTALETLWTNLPDYANGNSENAIVVADVSGSMDSQLTDNSNASAVDVSLALAIYFAERCTGPFKNHVITFSQVAHFIPLSNGTLLSKIKTLLKDRIAENTNLMSVFTLLLDTAVRNKVKEKDMIKTIYLVSDMEFDAANGYGTFTTVYEAMTEKYTNAGYKIPKVVFWNVMSRQTNVPVKLDQRGVVLVSGCSASIFKMTINNATPLKFMLQVINDARYNIVSEIIVNDTNTKVKKKKR